MIKTKRMQRLDITIPPKIVNEIDVLVKNGGYASRSEVLRVAFRKLYLEYLRSEAALLLPKNYESVRGLRNLKNRRWAKALKKAKGNTEKAKDIVIAESGTLR